MTVSIQKQTELRGHKWQISCLEFSPGGLHLASGGWDKCVKIWDLSTLEATFSLPHTSEVTSLSWLPGASHGKLIATASSDGSVSFWRGEDGTRITNLEKHSSWVLATSFNSDGELLATASWDRQIRLWNTSTGQIVGNLPGHTTGVWTIAFHPDKTSSLLCSGAADGSLKLWDTRLKTAALSLVGGHDDDVKCCAWSPNGASIASGSADSKIVIWEPRTGVALNRIRGHEDAVTSVQFYPYLTGNSIPLLFSSGDYTCRVWHSLRKRSKQLLSVKQHKSGLEVEALSISPDGTLLASGGHDMNIVLSNLHVHLTKVDALPIGEANDDTVTYGAMLWQKYTRKVIEKSQNKKVDSGKPNTFMPLQRDPRHRNTSSLVGKAIHNTEQKTKIYKSEQDTSSEIKRAHEREEQLLVKQRARLRRNRSESNPDELPANNGQLPNEVEVVRQHLRHVELDNHKENGLGDRAMDLTNNNLPEPTSKKNHGLVNGFGKVVEQNMHQGMHGVLDKDDSNPYHLIHDDKNGFQVYAEIHDNPYTGKRSIADSSSVSSSSYYADIEEVAREMNELADNQVEYDEKF